jgi:hypothetical protein
MEFLAVREELERETALQTYHGDWGGGRLKLMLKIPS